MKKCIFLSLLICSIALGMTSCKAWQTNIATSLLSASTAIILLRNYRLTISSV